MLEGSIAFTLSGATELKKLGFGSLTNTVCVAIDRRYGIKITTTLTCCEIVISRQISSRIKRHVELFVAVVAI